MSDSSFHGFWHIEPANDPRLKNLLIDWHLEAPQNGDAYDPTRLLQIRGWALAEESQHAHLHPVFRLPGLTLSHSMNQDRADVVEAILHEEASGHPRLICGFHHHLQPSDIGQGFTIGFETDGSIIEAVRLTVQPENPAS
jgi:hypothetical protein